MNSAHCSKCVCVLLDGLNAENTFHCWLYKIKIIYIYIGYRFFSKPISDYGKMLKYRSISSNMHC